MKGGLVAQLGDGGDPRALLGSGQTSSVSVETLAQHSEPPSCLP